MGADDDDDPIPPSSALDPAMRAQLKRGPWEAITPFVLDYGRVRGMKPKKVRGLLDQAWLKLRSAKYPWDPKKVPLFEHHVCWVIYGLARNDRTRARKERETEWTDDHEETVPASGESAEAKIAEEETQARREAFRDELLASIPEGHITRRLLEITRQGIATPAEQAEALGITVDDVYAALKALKKRATELRERWARENHPDYVGEPEADEKEPA